MVIYTDGACSGNGKIKNNGGFGVVAVDEVTNELVFAYRKLCENTTNNREELKAILYALIQFGKIKPTPIVYSDSAYSVNTLTNWMYSWERAGWIKSDKKEPKNLDLIKAYFDLVENQGYQINLQKVKGHNNILGNELADQLAHLDDKQAQEMIIKRIMN